MGRESESRKHARRATPHPRLPLLHITSVLGETRGTTGQRVPSRLGQGRHSCASDMKGRCWHSEKTAHQGIPSYRSSLPLLPGATLCAEVTEQKTGQARRAT